VAEVVVIAVADSPDGKPQPAVAVTAPLIKRFMICIVPVVPLALKPYTLNFKVPGEATEIVLAHVAVTILPQLALLGAWSIP